MFRKKWLNDDRFGKVRTASSRTSNAKRLLSHDSVQKIENKNKKFAKLKMARQVVGGGNQIQWNLNSGNQKYILHEHHVHPKVCYSQGWTIHCDSILILSL